jgi:hypothetical protein
MYQVKPQLATVSHQSPSQVATIHKLAIDAGNRFVKMATNTGTYKIFPSYLAKADFRDGDAVNYEAGDRKDLIGQRWHIGESAKFKNGQAVFYSEKSDLMPQMVLGVIAQLAGNTTNISSLNLCLPDGFNQNQNQALIAAIKGIHTINGNTYRIGSIQIHSECAIAYPYLLNSGVFKYARNNGIIDLGGGNSTGILVSPHGQPIWESKITLPGTIALAKMVANHPDLIGIEAKGNTPRLEIVMDAIATDYKYGSVRDISQAINDCLPDFLTNIKTAILTQWEPWLSGLGEIAVIGGSALLFQTLATQNQRIKICNDAQWANCKGMLCG